jgi:hypothetical protein
MYAFFMEAAAIEYHVERVCDLKQLGGLLDSKGYGVALPKGESLTLLNCNLFQCCWNLYPGRQGLLGKFQK